MGFFDFLFGEGPQVHDPITLPNLSPQQESLLQMILGQFSGQGGANFQPPGFEGQFVAPLTGAEEGTLGTLGTRANFLNENFGQAHPLVGLTTDTLTGFLSPDDRQGFFDFLNPQQAGGDIEGLLGQFSSMLQGGGGGGAFSFSGGNRQPFEEALEQLRGRIGTGGESKESIASFLQELVPLDTGQFEDFFRTNVQNPSLEAFQEDILPQIGRSFGGADFFSSERQSADTQAREDLLTQLTRARSGLEFKNLQDLRDRSMQIGQTAVQGDLTSEQQMLDALSRIMGEEANILNTGTSARAQLGSASLGAGASRFGSRASALSSVFNNLLGMQSQNADRDLEARIRALGFEDAGAGRALQATDQMGSLGEFLTGLPGQHTAELLDILGAQGLPREIDQTGLDRQYEEFVRQQDARDRRIAQILQSLGIRTMDHNIPVTQGSEGIAGDIISAIGMYMAAGASDYRLKYIFGRVGELASGLPIYLFRYLIGGPVQIGVIAQEAREIFPEAVFRMPNGYLAVDYSRIG